MSVSYIFKFTFIDQDNKDIFNYELGHGAFEISSIIQNSRYFKEFKFQYDPTTIDSIEYLKNRIRLEDNISNIYRNVENGIICPSKLNYFLKETRHLSFKVWRIYSRLKLLRHTENMSNKIQLLKEVLSNDEIESIDQSNNMVIEQKIDHYGRKIENSGHFISHLEGVLNYAINLNHRVRVELIIH